MNPLFVNWTILKDFATQKNISIQWIEIDNTYRLRAFDSFFCLDCSIQLDNGSEQIDFETNYKSDGNKRIDRIDPDTGGIASSPKWAPQGWGQVYHEIEWKTSQLNSINDWGIDFQDKGFTTANFYKDDGTELTEQSAIDTDCTITHINFMPTHDYAIKSGRVAQIASPDQAVYCWVIIAPGILDKVVCDGALNLEFIDAKTLVGLDGTAATVLPYYGGMGTNRIRFIIKHPAGYKHRIQAIFEYFKP